MDLRYSVPVILKINLALFGLSKIMEVKNMSDETLEMLWSMLTNEQLLELNENGAMDNRTMRSFKTELFKRCLISFEEAVCFILDED